MSTTFRTSGRLGRECFAHRLRFRFTCGTPSIRLIDCSLPGLQDPGDVVVADVDGGIYVCMHDASTMPACVSVPFPRSLVYRLAHRAFLARIACINCLHPYAVSLTFDHCT